MVFKRLLGGFTISPTWKLVIKEALENTLPVAKILCILHVTNTHLITPVLTYGPSMLPTISLTGDNLLLAERISPRLGSLTKGDIVLLRSPENPRKFITKRIVGMGGDTVSFEPKDGFGKKLKKVEVLVKEGHVWVQGDNLYNSRDSRDFGAVPYGLVQGRVFCRVWPFKEFGPVA